MFRHDRERSPLKNIKQWSSEDLAHMRRLYSYCPNDGLIRSTRTAGAAKAGKPVGTLDTCGYVRVRFLKTAVFAHRLAWFLHYGEWPQGEIDHINCNKADNRISNLREATREENMRNRPGNRDSAVPYKGVSIHKATGKYLAVIGYGARGRTKTKYLGIYDTAEAAALAYSLAARQLFGEFARGDA